MLKETLTLKIVDTMDKNLIAHVRVDIDGQFTEPQGLYNHLLATANLCQKNVDNAGLGKLGFIIGLAHDIGKASKAFQQRIRVKSQYDIDAHLEGKTAQHVDHSTAGAQYLVMKYGREAGMVLAYIIAGHHVGLPDGKGVSDAVLYARLKKKIEDYSTVLPEIDGLLPKDLAVKDFITVFNQGHQAPSFLIRILFSALTDADFLDTESYMSPEKSMLRFQAQEISDLFFVFDKFINGFGTNKRSYINQKRREILEQCLVAAELPRGIFSLTVPTGGGKTLSSMAFALKHAKRNDIRRVIYVIPYTSIIEQNADVFRDIFKEIGKNVILEHHSNLEPEKETAFNRLAAQNWDAPIVVTTNVQFFESFYKNRGSSCRKLHNIVNSIVIFDEAQMFPPEHLSPALAIISELYKNYGCSVVLCTATQPILGKSSLMPSGFEKIHEIIKKPEELYNNFKRVKINYIKEKLDPENIAERMSKYDQVLTIVNTRKTARLVFDSLPDEDFGTGHFHLSAMMCPDHRSDVLKKIRAELKNNKKCRVVSTQLIEAGVDVDFPVVYREIAGLDSIAQAAGRCNRENNKKQGDVFVFQSEALLPPGYLRQSAESGLRALKEYKDDPLNLTAIKSYFTDFYGKQKLAHGFDKKGIMDMARVPLDAIPFKKISDEFSLIEDITHGIIVPYGKDGEKIIESLRKCQYKIVPREIRRVVQRFIVQVHQNIFYSLMHSGVLEDLFEDGQFVVLINPDIYSHQFGLDPKDPTFLEIESTIK